MPKQHRSFHIRPLLVALLASLLLFTSVSAVQDKFVDLSGGGSVLPTLIIESDMADLSGGGSVLPGFVIQSDRADLSGGGSVLPNVTIRSDLADLSGGGSVLPSRHIAMLPSL